MFKPTLLVVALALSLAACTPRTGTPELATPPRTTAPETPAEIPAETPAGETLTLTDPAALEADRAAREAFHLMGLGFLETGRYSAEVLLTDLELPGGVLWEIREISDSSYELQLTSDGVPGVAWSVTPEGVSARQVEDNRIY